VALADLGWNDDVAARFGPWAGRKDVQPGRVVIEFNHIYRIAVEAGEIDSSLAGRLKHQAHSRAELPAVGDWVAVRLRPDQGQGAIVAVVPRRTRFSRRMAGEVTGEQVVAANVDVVFIVMALDGDFNLRRLERYLLLTRESGASPVILLTKPDLCADPAARVTEVITLAGSVPAHMVSPKTGQGLEHVAAYLTAGHTGALLGSSGVGKSTIINRLLGANVQKTLEVRASDSTGRHATVHRELIVLPGGGLVIDTPGMRELQLWDAGDAVRQTFDDIEALAGGCRFTNCRHREEPRCAVKAAVEDGRLEASRVESYHKLQAEIAYVERQQDERAQIDEKRRWRVITKAANKHIKSKRG
jgi:ribosome biogenesis GTPase